VKHIEVSGEPGRIFKTPGKELKKGKGGGGGGGTGKFSLKP
jgi:hypothetical protein